MISNILTRIFGSRNERLLKQYGQTVREVNALEPAIAALSDEALKGKTVELKGRVAAGEELDAVLPEAFAVVREAGKRALSMRHFDVQLMGGMALHNGKISEMRTGEGKTLVATLPAYLNALTGKGVHIVTVNDYLAQRDADWMGRIYKFLGLTVGVNMSQMNHADKQVAYNADITYGTNNEFGFDYLRDNMVFGLEQRVQREYVYGIIDEVDSILIDEARTPLIISGPVAHEGDDSYARFNRQVFELVRKQTDVVNGLLSEGEKLLTDDKRRGEAGIKLYQAQLGMPKSKRLMKLLNETGVKQLVQRVELDAIADRKLPSRQQQMRNLEDVLYFVLDEKGHSVHLTDQGAATMSPNDPALFLVPDISEEVHALEKDPSLSPADRVIKRREIEAAYATKSETLHVIHKLLQAHVLYDSDVDYIVQEGQVLIVDEFTGRIMPGRRWSDGLHQAVEAKEGVHVKGETQTFATITIQNYFRMYEKLAGMTGTAETEEQEFFQIYGLEVSVIPTHRPITRRDLSDRIYKSRKEKYDAIGAEVERLHGMGLPILIGTVSVDVSETLSKTLKRRGVKHEVLNAKYHQREAEIVAGAGQKGSVTIATNMAGRGTDIKLDKELDLSLEEAGLQIIGTERHESRRIDRQLRGRSGRQGDPGQSIFFLSLEDDLMRLFGSDRIAAWMDKSGAEEGEVITGGLITRAIENAQRRVELQNFQARKRLLEYDDVMNQQREVVYSLRLFALEKGEQLKAESRRMIDGALERTVRQFLATANTPEEYDRGALREALLMQYLVVAEDVVNAAVTPDMDEIVIAAQAEGGAAFQRKLEYLADFGKSIGVAEVSGQVLSQVMLSVLDEKWKDHLYDLDQLRNAIHYRGWGQKDPLVEYKKEAFDMFEDLMQDIQVTFAERFLKIQVSAEPNQPPPPPRPAPPPPRPASADDLFTGAAAAPPPSTRAAPVAPPVRTSAGPLRPQGGDLPEVGRNDPCPCGSGKKYKKCHGVGK